MRAQGIQPWAVRQRRVWAHGLQGDADHGSWSESRFHGKHDIAFGTFALFFNDEPVVFRVDLDGFGSGEIGRYGCEEDRVGLGDGLIGVEKFEERAAENATLLDEDREGLVETGGSEFETAGGRFAVTDIAPKADPGVVGGFPEIADEQPFGRGSSGNPAVRFVDAIGDDVGVGVIGEMAEIDGVALAIEGAGPEGGRFFWVRHWATLSEPLASVAVDEGGFVEERGTDGGMLDAVVSAAEFIFVRDGFADECDGLIF